VPLTHFGGSFSMLARHLHVHMQAKGTATLSLSVQQILGHCPSEEQDYKG
jgi:hypothetical protein